MVAGGRLGARCDTPPPMRTLLTALLFAGCTGSTTSTPSEPTPTEGTEAPPSASVTAECAGTPTYSLGSFETSCTADADCAMTRHRLDCCGSYAVLGLRADEVARFEAEEARCEPTVALCRCAARNDVATDGTSADVGFAAEVHCVRSECTTTFALLRDPSDEAR